MRRTLRTLAAACVGALLVAGCGGGHGASAPGGGVLPSAPGPIQPAATQFAWGSQLVSQLSYVGPAKGGGLSLAVYVRMRNPHGLVQYAQSASDPSSPNYRHWLTPQEIGDTYGAPQSDYTAVASYFKQYGLHVGTWPQREMLAVSGSMQQFQNAFGTTFGTYMFRGQKVIAPTSAPRFASSLPVAAIGGLMSAPVVHPYFLHVGNGSFLGYSPQQIATGFDYSGAYNAGFTGSGMNIGIIGTGPILNAQGGDDDTAALAKYWHAQLGTVTQVAVSPQPASTANGSTGTGAVDPNPAGLATPPPVTAPSCQQTQPADYTTCNPEDGEAQLDTESTASLAPGANTLFYLAYNRALACYDPSTGQFSNVTNGTCQSPLIAYQAEGIQLVDDEIQQAIADNTADTISMSFGQSEVDAEYYGYIGNDANPGLGQVEMASMTAEGMAVFASSGDDGAWECDNPATGQYVGNPCASYPASDPNVVAVGGVNIPLDENGNLVGHMAAWGNNTFLGGNGTFRNNVGSGGGMSQYFASPKWQAATVGSTMRELPDISLDADPNTGPSIFQDAAQGNFPYASGGTSAAAPEAAAQWAVLLQACKASSTCNRGGATGYRLGLPTPLLYAIYGQSQLAKGAYTITGFTPHLPYENVFYDIVYGGNAAVPAPGTTTSGYESGPGYDMVTGLGAPYTGHLIQAVVGTNVP